MKVERRRKQTHHITMRTKWLWIATFALAWFRTASAEIALQAPSFPPKAWTLWITINLSKDLLEPFLETKPGRSEFIYAQAIDFWVDAQGALRAPRHHAVLTGRLPSNNLAEHERVLGAGSVAYLPIADQKLLYENAFETIRSFRFTDDLEHATFDASGIDVELRLEVNGRAFSVRFEKIQRDEGLPKPILQALGSLRRNLPAEYTRFFEFLLVPKLDKLSQDQAARYAKCKVHNTWMNVDEVPISYGFPASRENYWKAAQELFPNVHNYLGGGCVVTPGSPKSGKTLYCESCRSAEKTWLRDNEPERKE